VCCSALQCVAVRCSAFQCIVVRCSPLQCVVVRCSALQCIAARCSVLQCDLVDFGDVVFSVETVMRISILIHKHLLYSMCDMPQTYEQYIPELTHKHLLFSICDIPSLTHTHMHTITHKHLHLFYVRHAIYIYTSPRLLDIYIPTLIHKRLPFSTCDMSTLMSVHTHVYTHDMRMSTHVYTHTRTSALFYVRHATYI